MREDGQASAWLPLELGPAALYLTGHLVFFSTLGSGIYPQIERLALLAMALAIAGAMARSAWRGEWWATGLALGAIGLIAAQMLVFSLLTGQPINWNAGLAYLPLAGFIVIFDARQRMEAALALLVGLSVAYCAAYAVVAAWAAEGLGIRLLAGDGRGARLMLANGYAGIALFYGLLRLRQNPLDWRWISLLALVALVLIEAQTRAYSAAALAVAALVLLRLDGERMRWVLALGFTLIVAVMLAGVAVPEWNPFGWIGADASGAARASAFDALRPLVAANPVTGIGLPGDRATFDAFVGVPYVFWEDLGSFGIWSAFGVVGLVGFMILACRSILGCPARSEREHAVALAALVAALFGVISPSLWSGSGSVLANVVLALWLAGPAALPVEQRAV